MDLAGILILITILISFGLAFYLHSKQPYWAILLILFAGLFCRIYTSSDPLLHKWDERYHALVAKHMMAEPFHPKLYEPALLEYDHKDWKLNHTWLHKQPFPLWMMACSMKVFGVNEFALRLPSALLATLAIWLTFLIGRKLYSAEVGFYAAFFHAINGLAIELASGRVATDHIDNSFLFFIELAVFLLLSINKRHFLFYHFLIGLSIGIAILCKWLPALIVLPIYFVFYFNQQSFLKLSLSLISITGMACLVFLPWQFYTYHSFPLEFLAEQAFNYRHITEGLDGHGHSWWYFLDRIRMVINETIYVVMIWFIYQVFKNRFERQDLVIFIWFLIPLLFFSLVKTKMQGYLLFTFPAFFIMEALFCTFLRKQVHLSSKKFAKIGYAILLVSIFLLALRYGIERIKPFQSHEKRAKAKQELLELNLPSKSVIFNVPCPLESMFYTDYIAYADLPKESDILQLQASGYAVYIANVQNLDEGIREKFSQLKLIELNFQSVCVN